MALLTHTAQVLQQMSILLRCCPSEKVSLQEWSPLPQALLSPLAMSSADDVLVTEVTQTLEVWTMSAHYYMANSVSEQEEPNPARWLATRAGEMALSCPLGITRCVPQENSVLFPYNKSLIDQACSVKMVGYWPRSFFLRVYGLRNLANIKPFWPHAWSITHIYWVSSWVYWHLNSWLKSIFLCVTGCVMCVFRFLWRVYLSQFQGSVKKVQQLSKDVRPYAAVSDHVLNNTSRDDSTAFIASW